MFKKSCLLLALIPFISVAAPGIDESDDVTTSMPDFATGKIEQSAGVKLGSGFISNVANNTIIIGNSAVAKGEGSVALGSKAVSDGMR